MVGQFHKQLSLHSYFTCTFPLFQSPAQPMGWSQSYDARSVFPGPISSILSVLPGLWYQLWTLVQRALKAPSHTRLQTAAISCQGSEYSFSKLFCLSFFVSKYGLQDVLVHPWNCWGRKIWPLKAAWTTHWVKGQPGLHCKLLSLKVKGQDCSSVRGCCFSNRLNVNVFH